MFAIFGSALIIFTTIHAQDFRDDDGDRELGRKTFTLTYPEFARWTMPVFLTSWTLVLIYVSNTNPYILYAMLALAIHTGFRFFTKRDAEADQFSYSLYNVSTNAFDMDFVLRILIDGVSSYRSGCVWLGLDSADSSPKRFTTLSINQELPTIF
jgi:hypothetical protein